MRYLTLATLLALAALWATGAAAAMTHDTPGHAMGASQRSQAMTEMHMKYMQAMDDMHRPMMEGVMDADPDAAFVRGMLPHHRGAVNMAKIQLKYGKDPELRKLAQDVIDAQEKEITFMEDWMKKHGHSK